MRCRPCWQLQEQVLPLPVLLRQALPPERKQQPKRQEPKLLVRRQRGPRPPVLTLPAPKLRRTPHRLPLR